MNDWAQSAYLKAAHLFFDLSLSQWERYIKELFPRDPFKESFFRKWPDLKSFPRNWAEALEISKSISLYKRADFYSENYPASLKKIPAPPPLIYWRGNEIPSPQSLISIVGTRKPSTFGKINATHFSQKIAAARIGIVSGLALGIDGIAHEEAVKRGVYTLAILGSGVDSIYPRTHKVLSEKILGSGGTILSPYPPGIAPLPHHFPRRNWLVAAMSSGTIIIEASEKSGAMITGKAALEMDIPVAVLTQDYRMPVGRGAIELIQCGANAVLSVEDAIERISMPLGGQMNFFPDINKHTEEKQEAKMHQQEFSIDEFCHHKNLNIQEGVVLLEILRREDKIQCLENGKFLGSASIFNKKQAP